MMGPIEHLMLLDPADGIALALLTVAWLGIGLWIERANGARPSVTVLMAEHRRQWMQEFLTRQNRIFDATVMSSLRQGASWFASTTIIAIGGVLALVGNPERVQGVAEELIASMAPTFVWQVKLLVVALFLSHAFLKFVWAHRVFGYCTVLMASVPNDPELPEAGLRAGQAAELNIRAALNFTRGLRSMYFALGTLAWLLGAVPLMIATVSVVWLLWSREFASHPRDILLGR